MRFLLLTLKSFAYLVCMYMCVCACKFKCMQECLCKKIDATVEASEVQLTTNALRTHRTFLQYDNMTVVDYVNIGIGR